MSTPNPVQIPVPDKIVKSPIPGFNVMLMGAAGTGKTFAIRSLIDQGITPFIIFTEPGMRTVSDIPCDKLHWHYIPPRKTSWADLQAYAQKVSQISFDALAKSNDAKRSQNLQYYEVISTMSNFKCDRCGKEFGDVSQWPTNRAIVLDSLSGLNPMVLAYVVGDKPVIAPGEWNIAQKGLMSFVEKITTDKHCHFIMIAHLERETDEVTGGVTLMASSIGKKLAPQLPRLFDDVVHVYRESTKFYWSTASINVDLKARNLPLATQLDPNFKILVETWQKAGGIIEA